MAPAPVRVPRRYLAARPPASPPVISVVTPSLQQGRFLERTIRSVVEQGYPALEYVVQDGGSADGSVDVIRRWEGSLSAWESTPDDNHAQALNRGFARTSGEIMAFLNSDDVYLPGALASVARFLTEHPGVDAVYGHRLVIDADDRRIDIGPVPPHSDPALRWSDVVPQETLFWRRSIWERSGAEIDERFHHALDWDLLQRFLDNGARLARLDRYLAAFRVHPEQKTQTQTAVAEREVARLRRRVRGAAAPPDEAPPEARAHYRRAVRVRRAHRVRLALPGRRVTPAWLAVG